MEQEIQFNGEFAIYYIAQKLFNHSYNHIQYFGS